MKNAPTQPLILLTCVFVAFILGLCGGRNLNRTPVQIHALPGVTAVTAASSEDAADPVESAASSEDAADPVESAGQTEAVAETEFVGPGVVNINTATAEQLQMLEGIGSVLAERIITYRETYGNFQSIGELMNVSGIGEKKLEAIWDLITTGG